MDLLNQRASKNNIYAQKIMEENIRKQYMEII